MARKPESTFHNRINKKLTAAYPEIYYEKTHNPFRGGTPDFYYEALGTHMWIEYKWLNRLPSELNLTAGNNPTLTRLQSDWLDRAHGNGHEALVVAGFALNLRDRGALIFTSTLDRMARPWALCWQDTYSKKEYMPKVVTEEQLLEIYASLLGRT